MVEAGERSSVIGGNVRFLTRTVVNRSAAGALTVSSFEHPISTGQTGHGTSES